jgi:hypothetical protein
MTAIKLGSARDCSASLRRGATRENFLSARRGEGGTLVTAVQEIYYRMGGSR